LCSSCFLGFATCILTTVRLSEIPYLSAIESALGLRIVMAPKRRRWFIKNGIKGLARNSLIIDRDRVVGRCSSTTSSSSIVYVGGGDIPASLNCRSPWHHLHLWLRAVIVRNGLELRGGGATPLSSKKRDPPPFCLRPYKVKKINKNVRKRAKIAKNAKSR
jgi:hypothetical protein